MYLHNKQSFDQKKMRTITKFHQTNALLAIALMLMSFSVFAVAVRSPDTDIIPMKGAPTDITGLTMEEIVGNIHRE
jgi:hypothetical protein